MECPLHPEEDDIGTCEDVASFSQGSATILAIRALLTEILAIEAPSLKVSTGTIVRLAAREPSIGLVRLPPSWQPA